MLRLTLESLARKALVLHLKASVREIMKFTQSLRGHKLVEKEQSGEVVTCQRNMLNGSKQLLNEI